MTVTSRLLDIRSDLLRVPVWSLYFPLVILPDFLRYMCWCALVERSTVALKRLGDAECWENMFAFYLIGLDGWKEYE